MPRGIITFAAYLARIPSHPLPSETIDDGKRGLVKPQGPLPCKRPTRMGRSTLRLARGSLAFMQIATISTRKYKTLEAPEPSFNEANSNITTIRTTSQKTTPSAKQPLFPVPQGKLMVFYLSLAVSHGVEMYSRTNEAKTQLSARGNASSISSFIG